MIFKKFFRIIIVLIFACCLIGSIVVGEMGIEHYFGVKQEIVIQKDKVSKLENIIKNLENKIETFLVDDFELERMAREELQMGFADERVYLLPEN